jgi:manganese efflux pump family protein
MEFSPMVWGQVITISIIAIALSMDAFSLGLGLGIRNPSQKRIFMISGLIAFFHVFMPLLGIFIGHFLSHYFHYIATTVGGALLCLLGLQMFWSSIRDKEDNLPFSDKTLLGIMLFAFTVSLDSLSAGLSLGFFASDPLLVVLLCGLAGGVMSWVGLQFGRMMGNYIGKYGEVFGGIVLITLGAQFIW